MLRAIHEKGAAGHEARLVAGQERDHGCDLHRPASLVVSVSMKYAAMQLHILNTEPRLTSITSDR
jgi:hypothetical protein